MNVTIEPVPVEQKSVLRNLLELYQYDFSECENTDVNDHGLYGYRYLDNYWTEPERSVFFIKVEGKLAGFVMVRSTAEDAHFMSEFFVMRKYRRHGIGRAVAFRIFEMFPGKWRVAQGEVNLVSQAFWRKVIGEYTSEKFEEIKFSLSEGLNYVAQEFETQTGQTQPKSMN